MTLEISLGEYQSLLLLNQMCICYVFAQKIICYVGKHIRI